MRRPALVPLLLLPLVAAAAIAEERKLTITESTAVAADGTRIYYRVAGSGDDVVLAPFAVLHGAQLDGLASAKRRIVTYDPRGRGRSATVPPEKVSLDLLLSDLEAVRKAVDAESIAIIGWQHDELTIDVRCSKGTYIRTLGEDIGAALGCGAHLDTLRRVASGALGIEAATTLAQLDGLDEASLDARLLPPDALVAAWPRVVLTNEDAGRFLAGVRRRLDLDDAPALRVYGPERGAFLGTGHVVAGELIASRLLSPAEVGDLVAARRQPFTVSESLSA